MRRYALAALLFTLQWPRWFGLSAFGIHGRVTSSIASPHCFLKRQKPIFTTDTAASLRSIEINAELLIKATKVDGVYTADPMKDPAATLYKRLTYDEALDQRLNVMDASALVLCRDHDMPLRVMNVFEPGAVMRLVMGEDIGSLIETGKSA